MHRVECTHKLRSLVVNPGLPTHQNKMITDIEKCHIIASSDELQSVHNLLCVYQYLNIH